jgi:hypothetical protein
MQADMFADLGNISPKQSLCCGEQGVLAKHYLEGRGYQCYNVR